MTPDPGNMLRQWRAVARYEIIRHRLAENGFYRVYEPVLGYDDLTYDEGKEICDRLNHEARNAAAKPWSAFAAIAYTLALQTPLPVPWTSPRLAS